MTAKFGDPPDEAPVNSLSHLNPNTRKLARRAAEERIASLSEDRWIDYACAQKALAQMQWMLKEPPKTRMPGLLVYGDSNREQVYSIRIQQ